ncbi:carbon-nitrogen hydrolase family protein [Salmonirosea aquatica]|uniref:Carbon-nitrogen hydrolase family protein n=1 Tax=Salmonirosea aquatica TaxID=2654236 RepID=A0A7C9FNM7_9BACT|nr:carbon-nitrogen hydrolase family protein [Cytophagaceae bacterium SJW1-29]
MKIAIAQIRSMPGDIPGNIVAHKKLIDRIISYGADTLIFPELSLTGYEPTLAHALAMDLHDGRLDDFQALSNYHRLTLGVGVPLKTPLGITISLVIFQLGQPRQVYTKRYLHPDEEAFFVSGQGTLSTLGSKGTLALAICYELSVPAHAEAASKNGAEIYLASVAKTARGIPKAEERLSSIAKDYGMTVLMANCVGPCEGEEGGGKSGVWNSKGALLAQMNERDEGVLLFDLDTQQCQCIGV